MTSHINSMLINQVPDYHYNQLLHIHTHAYYHAGVIQSDKVPLTTLVRILNASYIYSSIQFGKTPLHYAVEEEKGDVVRYFTEELAMDTTNIDQVIKEYDSLSINLTIDIIIRMYSYLKMLWNR